MKIYALALLLTAATPLAAEELPAPLFEDFQTVCIPKKAVGFDWERGEWVPETFQPGKPFVIKKIIRDTEIISRPAEVATLV